MRAEYPVISSEELRNADRNCFLANAQVHRAANDAIPPHRGQLLLYQPNQQHRS
jgi:hypothetical protein